MALLCVVAVVVFVLPSSLRMRFRCFICTYLSFAFKMVSHAWLILLVLQHVSMLWFARGGDVATLTHSSTTHLRYQRYNSATHFVARPGQSSPGETKAVQTICAMIYNVASVISCNNINNFISNLHRNMNIDFHR